MVGFATVAAGSLERGSVPSARLRKRLPAYPLPVVRLARLGIDLRAQGHGIGKALLRHVLSLACNQRDSVGCVGVVADATLDAVTFYAALGFDRLAAIGEGLLHGDPTPMFLPIESVVAALRALSSGGLRGRPNPWSGTAIDDATGAHSSFR